MKEKILFRLQREADFLNARYYPFLWKRVAGRKPYLFAKVELPDGTTSVWGVPYRGRIVKSTDPIPVLDSVSDAEFLAQEALWICKILERGGKYE